MKRNFDHKFTEITGEPLMYREGVEFTLKIAAVNALQQPYNDENLDGTEQIARYDLAVKINSNDVVDLTSEEITLVKRLINKMYKSPVIVAPSWKILDSDMKMADIQVKSKNKV